MLCDCYSCQAGRAMKEGLEKLKKEEAMKDKAALILKEAAELKVKKSKDYQGGMWSEKDYFPFGDESYIHMMWTKMLRIRSVAEKENVNFESLEDSLLDMINYSAMYIAYLRDKDSGEFAPKKGK